MIDRISASYIRLFICVAAPLLLTVPAIAQAPSARHVREVRAMRSATAIALDGRLDEPAWREAQVAADFLQSEPDEARPASERTEIRLVYDDEALYIGARMFDSDASQVRRRLSRRDDYHIDADYVIVYLDPHHDHLTGARFQVTAAGSLGDAALYNDVAEDESWDGVWDAKVTVDDRGWTAEIRVPFSQLRFTGGDRRPWGLNVERFIRRKNESDWWELVLKKESGRVSRFGHLDGLDGIPPRPHLDLLPYTTARAEYVVPAAGDPFNSGSRYFGNAGLDLKWGVTSNMTIDATVNPDFGQVEVDPAVVNLTAFETFYEEKRPFFTEGSNIFGNFGRSGSNSYAGFDRADPTLFYSRRIGRSPQGAADGDFVDRPAATTILGAAKLTGKTDSGWSVGLIEAVTGRESARVDSAGLRSNVEVEPPTNYAVGRLKRDMKRSSVGFMFTSVERALGGAALGETLDTRAYAFGTDGHLFLDSTRDWVVHGLLAGSYLQGSPDSILRLQRSSARYFQRPDAPQVRLDPARTSLSGWDGQLNLNKNSGDVTMNAAVWSVSPGFEVNDIGYFTTADRVGAHAFLLWKKPTPDRWTRRRTLMGAKFWAWNFNREMQADGYFLQTQSTLLNYWEFNGRAILGTSSFDDRLTRGGPSMRTPARAWSLEAGIESDSRKPVGLELDGNYETNTAGAFGSRVKVGLDIRPSPSLTVSTGPEIVRSRSIAQYIRTVVDPLAAGTFGSRYVFGDLGQTEISMTTEMAFIFTPKASLQVYVQPLLSTGNFWNFKELARARTLDFMRYGQNGGTLAYDSVRRVYTADPDGAGAAPAFTFADPDFNFKSLRVNAIFRWEWRLGSALYVVWTQQREDMADRGDFAFRRDISALFGARGDNVFAVKLAYWLTR